MSDYLAALAAGDTARLVALFSSDGVVISPLYGARPAAAFFAKLASSTVASEITSIRFFISQEGVAAAQFLHRWTLVSGEYADFECVGIFEFAGDGRIRKLTLVHDTQPLRVRMSASAAANGVAAARPSSAMAASAGLAKPGNGGAAPGRTGVIPFEADAEPSSPDAACQQRHEPVPEDLALTAEAQALLAALTPEERPEELARAYPRIVNAVAMHRNHARELEQYFASLLTLDRKDRHGFPFKVLMELESLKAVMLRAHHRPDPFWD